MVIKKIVNYIGVASAIAFAMLPALFMIAPIFQVAEETSAVTSIITVGEIMSLAVQDEIDIRITPSPTGTFSVGGAEVIADGNYRGGYSLLMSSDSDPADMTYKDGSGNVISSILNLEVDNPGYGIAGSEIPVNTYGYSVKGTHNTSSTDEVADESDTFYPVPTSDKVIAATTGPETITPTVSYGVHVDFDTQTGVYTNTVTFTWVSNYAPATTPAFYSATSMQDMTPEICTSVRYASPSSSHTTYFDTDGTHLNDYDAIPAVDLVDERDGKTYRVIREKDGCHMAVPLEVTLESLEDNGVETLDSTNTDLPYGDEFDVEDLLYTAEITHADGEAYYEFDTESTIAKFDNAYEGHTVTTYYYSKHAAMLEGTHRSICPAGWKLGGHIILGGGNGHVSFTPDSAQSDLSWNSGIIMRPEVITGYDENDQAIFEENSFNGTVNDFSNGNGSNDNRSMISCSLKM